MKSAMKHEVPKFGLYGEHPSKRQPEFVHIEKISDRSSQNDWTIKPHRHGRLFQVLFLFDGGVTLTLDGENRQLRGNWAICIPPGTVHGFSFPISTNGEVLTIETEMLVAENNPSEDYLQGLMNRPQVIQFNESTALFSQIRQYLNLVRLEISNTESHYTLALNWLVKMIMLNLKRQQDNAGPIHTTAQHSKRIMLSQFRQLLEDNFRRHWSVNQYAKALHTSPSSLNRLCANYLGVTAKQTIQDRILVEIKRRLIYTREPIDSVAYTLGFKDPSYFSRLFKKLEGETPSAYRLKKYRETDTVTIK